MPSSFLPSCCVAARSLATKSSSLSSTVTARNCGKALKKADESRSFRELAAHKDVSVLQGIGPKTLEALHTLGIKSVHDLATYKHYHVAKAVVILAETEEDVDMDAIKKEPKEQPTDTSSSSSSSTTAKHRVHRMNLDKAVDKAYETKTLREIADAPVAALQGISDTKGSVLASALGVSTVRDLAKLKYCLWAESMETLSRYEQDHDEE